MAQSRPIKRLLQAFHRCRMGVLDVFYPHLCIGCGVSLPERDIVLCDTCVKALPRTEHAQQRDNQVEQIFADIPLAHSLVRGGAFCYYEYGAEYRDFIHAFKYQQAPQIGVFLAELAAKDFAPKGFFDDVDLLVPVPLHKKRLREREYNQSELICEGLTKVTHLPIDTTHLVRTVNNSTQTKKTVEERKQNTHNIFTICNPKDWQGKHILLVDDIITTGATMHACIAAMKGIRGLRVSIFALGLARIPVIAENNSTL